ncbi:hypothetical protein I314_05957 [Cryptococcus bacillisporus CA1873]|uniref:Uncharacterized protein n=2 Tax=Cryptococcus gattii TaxID=552467 RepID=A0A0D0UBV2_CRYGA|nr:hypothetical protein I312_05110 [Cryptococcus bacillisporus CA1280]KIR58331.1 hypothetical protein I314_05957 [Cryptococcus bacillisporus CA1873]|eukprot:KIR58331.1 hypothetical protein I314_05957 [Cryptococcus gattii CA1873]
MPTFFPPSPQHHLNQPLLHLSWPLHITALPLSQPPIPLVLYLLQQNSTTPPQYVLRHLPNQQLQPTPPSPLLSPISENKDRSAYPLLEVQKH